MIIRLCLCLLLAVATTVVMATLLAEFVCIRSVDWVRAGRTTDDNTGWFVREYRRPGVKYVVGRPIVEIESYRAWAEQDHLHVDPGSWPGVFDQIALRDSSQGRVMHLNMRGWPLPALWCESTINTTRSAGLRAQPKHVGAIVWRRSTLRAPTLAIDWETRGWPYLPIWPGFIADTLIFAGGWAFVLACSAYIRRRWQLLSVRSVVACAGGVVLLAVTTAALTTYCSIMLADNAPPSFSVGRIHWRQFLIHLAIGVPVWLAIVIVVFGFAPLRRTMRQRRMRCPYCGYDMRGAAGNQCPECGKATQRATPRPSVVG